eukprot:gnl/MRDRNA2_/MRDRNA2_17416_c0_seq1.p1 gnl/MRDRNA2_/MRDRNA2_17416_c0~~gnl/MRDRNA2_/MRDRNA2_17416_c0_seq1.p1  ORF type:complete len:414 (-),score=81.40 gnl/MRDRNA2_/MRDRNA2_17416_c0_seq1:25-1266(-)
MPWREIYWKIWGRAQTLYCTQCQQHFSASDYGHCQYHPERPIWTKSNVGTYPCCQQQVLRFDTSIYKTGCSARKHVAKVDPANNSSSITDKLLRHSNLVCVPYEERDKGPFLTPDARELMKVRQGGNVGENSKRVVDEEDEDESDSDGDHGIRNTESDRTPGYWRSYGWEASCSQPSAYCLDPPPEHCYPMEFWHCRDPFFGKRGLTARANRSAQSKDESDEQKIGSKKMPVSMPDCKKECKDAKDAALSRSRRSRSATKADRPQSQASSRAVEGKAESSNFGERRGMGGGVDDSGRVGQRGGSAAPGGDLNPAGQKSFFELGFPTGMTGKKQREFRMDMLREDDRRRMDELGGRIRTQKTRCTVSPGVEGKRALAWVSEGSVAKAAPQQSSQKSAKALAGSGRSSTGFSKTR